MDAPTPDGRTMKELAADVVAFSLRGLNRRGYLNGVGDNEGGFLDPLREVVATGITPADRLLDKFENEWHGDVKRIYSEFSF
jgi:glutamate--cysteine ligase